MSSVVSLLTVGAILQLAGSRAWSQERTEEEHPLIVEVGATTERELGEGSTHFGPAIGLEVEPIENWLEIEFGASTFRSGEARVWDFDLAFKKPWRLSETVEVMPGLGPTWEHTNAARQPASTWGAEAVVDWFFWRNRRVGFFVEPAYGIAFRNGHGKSVTITAGFFAAIP